MRVFLEHKKRFKDPNRPGHPLYHPKYRVDKNIDKRSAIYSVFDRSGGSLKYLGKLNGHSSDNEFHVDYVSAAGAGGMRSPEAEHARLTGQRFLPRDAIAHVIKHIKKDFPRARRLLADRRTGANAHEVDTRLRGLTPGEKTAENRLKGGHLVSDYRYHNSDSPVFNYKDKKGNNVQLGFHKSKGHYVNYSSVKDNHMTMTHAKNLIRQFRELPGAKEVHFDKGRRSIILHKPKKSVFFMRPENRIDDDRSIVHSRKGKVGNIELHHGLYHGNKIHVPVMLTNFNKLANKISFGDKRRLYKVISKSLHHDTKYLGNKNNTIPTVIVRHRRNSGYKPIKKFESI